MPRNNRKQRLKRAQHVVARHAPQDRDLVAELLAERRAEAATEDDAQNKGGE